MFSFGETEQVIMQGPTFLADYKYRTVMDANPKFVRHVVRSYIITQRMELLPILFHENTLALKIWVQI